MLKTTYGIERYLLKLRWLKADTENSLRGESKSMTFENDNHILTDIPTKQPEEAKNLAK